VRVRQGAAGLLLTGLAALAASAWPLPAQARNLLIFVADGLRADSVNPVDAPTLSALAARGVRFADSHAVFPTFTTPNAATIATGEYPGQTGDFSNSLYAGYRLFNAGNYAQRTASATPFLESDLVLGDLDDHYQGRLQAQRGCREYNSRAEGRGDCTSGRMRERRLVSRHSGDFRLDRSQGRVRRRRCIDRDGDAQIRLLGQ